MSVRVRKVRGNVECDCCQEWEADFTIRLGTTRTNICKGCAHTLLVTLIKAGKSHDVKRSSNKNEVQ